LSQSTRVTDRQTDRILIARPRLHSMQRGKNAANGTPQHNTCSYIYYVQLIDYSMISLLNS